MIKPISPTISEQLRILAERNSVTGKEMANIIGISERAYTRRLTEGNFTTKQVETLAEHFGFCFILASISKKEL